MRFLRSLTFLTLDDFRLDLTSARLLAPPDEESAALSDDPLWRQHAECTTTT